MEGVWLLPQVHSFDDGGEDVKVIGIYDARESALAAIVRLKLQPGFCDYPDLVDPSESSDASGFYLDRYPLNQDHWRVGFVTCWVNESGAGSMFVTCIFLASLRLCARPSGNAGLSLKIAVTRGGFRRDDIETQQADW
ncbi:MAG: hypothetical protein R3F42_11930 [Pseudomonadota bacterium]